MRIAMLLPAMVLFCGPQVAAQAPVHLRIGVLLNPEVPELRRGIAFGLQEVRHTAALVGGTIDTVNLALAPAARVDAVVVGNRAPADATAPVIALLPIDGAMGATTLRLQPHRDDSAAHRRVVVWHSSLERFGAEQLNARYRAATGQDMSPDAWAGWFAVKLLWDSATRLRGQSLDHYLRDTTRRFDGHKGAALFFSATGELSQPLYVIEKTGSHWRVVSEVKP
jgi:hypothetical protein